MCSSVCLCSTSFPLVYAEEESEAQDNNCHRYHCHHTGHPDSHRHGRVHWDLSLPQP